MLSFRKAIYKSKLIQTTTKFLNTLDQPEFKTLFQEAQELPGREVESMLHRAANAENQAIGRKQYCCITTGALCLLRYHF